MTGTVEETRLRPVAELRALAQAGARTLEGAPAEQVVEWAVEQFGRGSRWPAAWPKPFCRTWSRRSCPAST